MTRDQLIADLMRFPNVEVMDGNSNTITGAILDSYRDSDESPDVPCITLETDE